MTTASSSPTGSASRWDLKAKRGATEVDRWVVTAIVDTDGDHGQLLTSRPTVYPDATVVDDSVLLTYLREHWEATEDAYPGEDNGFSDRIPLRLLMSIVSSRGRLVWAERGGSRACPHASRGTDDVPTAAS